MGRIVEGAHFLPFFPRWQLLHRYFKDGLVIDGKRRISRNDSYRHTAVLAPSGAGKTTKFVIPNLLRAKRDASYVVLDPSGEVFDLTSGYLASKGFRIKTFNVADPSRSLQYNPLARAKTATEIEQLCAILVNAAYSDTRADQDFWNRGAMSLLSILIRCLANQPDVYRHLAGVYRLLNRFGADGQSLYHFIAKNADEQTFSEFKGLISSDLKVIQGMAATARTALAALSDPNLALLTARETLCFESVREEPTILYIQIPEHRVRYYGFLLAIFWQQFFSACMSTPKSRSEVRPVYALMDEFGNTGRIPDFEGLITTLRKRKVSVSLLLQDIEQLTATYGRAQASAIVNGGSSSRIFLPGLSHETCREIEGILGRQTIRENGRTENRPLLAADEIRTLADDQALYIFANRRPVLLTMQPYFKNLRLKFRSQLPPFSLDGDEHPAAVDYLEINSDSEVSHPSNEKPPSRIEGDAEATSLRRDPRVQTEEKRHQEIPKENISEAHVAASAKIEEYARQTASTAGKKPKHDRHRASSDRPADHDRDARQAKYIQELIKRWSEKNGWAVTIQDVVSDRGANADIVLERGKTRIACRIAVTVSPEHELGNLQEWLTAGFEETIVVSADRKILRKAQTYVAQEVGTERSDHILVLTPEQLFSHLASKPTVSEAEVTDDHRIDIGVARDDAAEQEARRQAVNNIIAESMRRMKTRK